MAKLLFLGTGSSKGIPVIGCSCAVCQTNKRLRPSAIIEVEGKRFLIDAGPDLRQQALMHGIDRLDGFILTHTHFDHIAGIDELRSFNFLQKKPMPTLLSRAAYDELQKRYYYLFTPPVEKANVTAQLDCHILEDDYGETIFEEVAISYVSYWQVGMRVYGYRFGDIAYITDIQAYGDEIFEHLRGVKILVLSSLKYTETPLHLSVPQAVEFAQKVGAERTLLTHIDHAIDHDEINAKLPDGVELAYDGLEITDGS